MSPWDRRRRRKRNRKRSRMNNRKNSSRDHKNSQSSSRRENGEKSSRDRQNSQSSRRRENGEKSSRDRQNSQSSSRRQHDEKSSRDRRSGSRSSRHLSNGSNTPSPSSNNSSVKSAAKNVGLKLTKRRPKFFSHFKKESSRPSGETSNADDGDASSSRRRSEKTPRKSQRSSGKRTTRNFGAASARAGRVSEPSVLFDQLKRAVTDERIRIVRSRIQHIWDRHGCRRNAEFQKILPKNKNKMPSYFNSSDILVNSVSSTVQRPNWSRPSPGRGPSKRVGFKIGGMNRFRGRKKNRPSMNKSGNNNDNGRKLLFKSFNRPIGVSGVGYGTSSQHDNAECFTCCAVVGTDGTLITAYPILTQEALNRGQGPKTVFNEHPSIITDSDQTQNNVDQEVNDEHNEERSRKENNDQ